MKVLVALILLASFSSGAFAQGNELESLKKRIEDLEKQQEQLLLSTAEPRTNVHTFLRDDLTLGGFFQSGYTFITGPDTETQAVNDSNIVGFNLSANFGKRFRFVSQVVTATILGLENRNNDPTTDPKEREYNSYVPFAAVTQGYVEYTFSRLYNLQAGLGYVPFGFALQLREPVLYIRRDGPQLVRNSSLISILWQGLHLYGSKNFNNGEIGYNLYTLTPTQDPKLPGVGGRVWFSSENERVVGGLSTQLVETEEETYTLAGSDLRLDFYPYQLRTEVLQKFTQDSDSWSFYVEPGYFVFQEEILLYVFGDYLFGAQNETGSGSRATDDPIQKWEYGGGVNWLPTSYTRFRLGITFHDYVGYRSNFMRQDRDYFSTDLSVGVAF